MLRVGLTMLFVSSTMLACAGQLDDAPLTPGGRTNDGAPVPPPRAPEGRPAPGANEATPEPKGEAAPKAPFEMKKLRDDVRDVIVEHGHLYLARRRTDGLPGVTIDIDPDFRGSQAQTTSLDFQGRLMVTAGNACIGGERAGCWDPRSLAITEMDSCVGCDLYGDVVGNSIIQMKPTVENGVAKLYLQRYALGSSHLMSMLIDQKSGAPYGQLAPQLLERNYIWRTDAGTLRAVTEYGGPLSAQLTQLESVEQFFIGGTRWAGTAGSTIRYGTAAAPAGSSSVSEQLDGTIPAALPKEARLRGAAVDDSGRLFACSTGLNEQTKQPEHLLSVFSTKAEARHAFALPEDPKGCRFYHQGDVTFVILGAPEGPGPLYGIRAL